MAKSKSFYGLRKGSTKSLTFSVYNGLQVTKDRVTSVKNPRSQAQQYQRYLSYSVNQAYSLLKSITNHSFQSYSYGLQNMRRFLKVNYSRIKNNPEVFEGSYFQSHAMGDGPWQIAEGSLRLPGGVTPRGELVQGGETVLATIPGTGTITVEDIHKALGLDTADFLTVVSPQTERDPDTDKPIFQELMLARIYKSNLITDTAVGTAGGQTSFADAFEVQTNSDTDGIFLSGRNIVISLEGDVQNGTKPFTVVLSQKTEKGWLRNNAILPFSKVSAAIESWPIGTARILNGGAGQGLGETELTGRGEVTGEITPVVPEP